MEECLTALDNHAAARHSAQPICWKFSLEDRWMLLLAALPTRTPLKSKGCCSRDFPSCQSYPSKGGKRRKEKSPPHKCLLLQLPRQNSQQDTSPEVSERATENPVQEKPRESSGAAGAAMQQAAALNVPQGSPSPSKYCSQRASQLRINRLLLHVFLFFMCSEEVSFLLVFLWLAGILVLDTERHVINTFGWKASVQNELCTQALLGQRISVLILAQQSEMNSVYSPQRLFSHCTHALPMPSGIDLACGCHCSVKPSCFLFHRQLSKNTTLSLRCFYYLIAQDGITSFFKECLLLEMK